MKIGLAGLLTVFLLTGALADSGKGLKPRPNVFSYPVHQQQQAIALGAEQLSNTQVQHAFSTELDKRYIVVEIGVFPAKDGIILASNDFMLRVPGTNQMLRPVAPETIASVLHKKPATERDITVTPTMGVGYETGGSNSNGTRDRGGWSTSTGAIVGIDKKPVGGTEADRKTMETELRDKQLPPGEAKQPIAGYLYFPVPSKKTKGKYELLYLRNGEMVSLALNAPSD